ncbi:hypothetical protein QTO34_006363 [Cnephaeus nilssonii]|uniref:Uncharacterized protein n=1 Tax=Cnephaeus nilssonii TaxID=3371016 RepID=A0AA40HL45_CNENI|nr:hypothetical protein QTO34_006363 [Eptesicus nilssonii]
MESCQHKSGMSFVWSFWNQCKFSSHPWLRTINASLGANSGDEKHYYQPNKNRNFSGNRIDLRRKTRKRKKIEKRKSFRRVEINTKNMNTNLSPPPSPLLPSLPPSPLPPPLPSPPPFPPPLPSPPPLPPSPPVRLQKAAVRVTTKKKIQKKKRNKNKCTRKKNSDIGEKDKSMKRKLYEELFPYYYCNKEKRRLANGIILILAKNLGAITTVQRREDLKEMRGAGEAGAEMREAGEAEAEVIVVTSKENEEWNTRNDTRSHRTDIYRGGKMHRENSGDKHTRVTRENEEPRPPAKPRPPANQSKYANKPNQYGG